MKKGNVLYVTGFTLLSGMILTLMILVNCKWFAYIVLAVLYVIAVYIKIQKDDIRISFGSWFILIILSSALLTFARTNSNISFVGTLTSKVIDLYMNGFDREKYYSVHEKEWEVPKGYSNTKYDLSISTIELLQKTKKSTHNKIIYQLHGGAYIRKIANEYRDIAVKYSKLVGSVDVATLDYRTAPEYVYPAALEDAVDGYEFLMSKGYAPENIIVVGDSAGGNLALSLTSYLRDHNYDLPKGIVVMSPWADLSEEGESYTYNRYKDIMFGVEKGEKPEKYPISIKYAGNTDLHDKYLSPVYGSYEKFPSMLIQVGTYEMLESDSITIDKKAVKAGVDVKLTRYEGMFHQFEFYGFLPESKAAWKEVKEFIEKVW